VKWLDQLPSPIQISFFFSYAIFAFFYLRWTFRNVLRQRTWRNFVRGVASVVRKAPPERHLSQLQRNYDSYASLMVSMRANIRSFPAELWRVVHIIDWRSEKTFKGRYGVLFTDDERNRLAEIVDELERQNPFAQLPRPWSSRLLEIVKAIERGDKYVSVSILNDVAHDLQQHEEVLRKEDERRQRRNIAYQWIGIGLTVVTFIVGTVITLKVG
jgi:hypothetical protein